MNETITERTLRSIISDRDRALKLKEDEILRLRAVLEDICQEAADNPDHPTLTQSIAVRGLKGGR